jgi:hypothetical protein
MPLRLDRICEMADMSRRQRIPDLRWYQEFS